MTRSHTGDTGSRRRPRARRPRADAEAPRLLVELTVEVRRIVRRHDDHVDGNCVEACMALGRALLDRGLPATMRSFGGVGGDWHWCITSGEWVLDPTAGQWGKDPVIVFRAGSADDWYSPGSEGVADLTDDEDIVHRFAVWIGEEYASALLDFAGRADLLPKVLERVASLAAERAERAELVADEDG